LIVGTRQNSTVAVVWLLLALLLMMMAMSRETKTISFVVVGCCHFTILLLHVSKEEI